MTTYAKRSGHVERGKCRDCHRVTVLEKGRCHGCNRKAGVKSRPVWGGVGGMKSWKTEKEQH